MTDLPPERKNPFVGPRSIETGEPLYGRDRETAQLANLLVAERVVLLYSPSGAGKTSLIKAGLIPRLSARRFHLLPAIRLNLEPPSEFARVEGFNRYVFSALACLEEGKAEQHKLAWQELVAMSLSDYLEQIQHPATMLIFDQFEEILTLHPADREAKLAFFEQLGGALQTGTRWALFAMREDYIAALDPYLLHIPTRLANSFRLDLLDRNAARQVMQKTAAQENVTFTDEAAEKLAGDLSRIHLQRPDGSFDEQAGLYVEPVQLQVVCHNLWNVLDPLDGDITAAEIETIGDVDKSLADYYAAQVAQAAGKMGVHERRIREWFDRGLITKSGIRGQILMGGETSDGLPNEVIDLLEHAHLVRRDTRRGTTWFELSHDRLIEPVRSDNAAWFQDKLSILQRQATLWERQNRSETLYLRDEALDEAQAWATENPDELSEVDREFLVACLGQRQREAAIFEAAERERVLKLELAEQAAEAERQRAEVQFRAARRLRRLAGFLIIVLLAAIFLASAAISLQRDAILSAETAETQRAVALAAGTEAARSAQEAQYSLSTATAALGAAENNWQLAMKLWGRSRESAATAVYAQRTAQAMAYKARFNEIQAKSQASVALSRQLASQSAGYQLSDPRLAALLAVEAYRASDTREAKSALLAVLPRGEDQLLKMVDQIKATNQVEAVDFSPDGRYLAWATSDGIVTFLNMEDNTQKVLQSVAADRARIYSIEFSPDNRYLVSGSLIGKVTFWEIPSGAELGSYRFLTGSPVRGLSFSPDGTYLASGVGTSLEILETAPFLEKGLSLATWQQRQDSGELRPAFSLSGFSNYVYAVAWSPNGHWVAAGSADRSVRVWDMDGNRVFYGGVHRDTVWSLDWSPDSRLLASGGGDRKIFLWDIAAGRIFAQAEASAAVYSVAFSPDGRRLASGGYDEKAILWDVQEGTSALTRLAENKAHNLMIVNLDFSQQPGRLVLASAGYDRLVSLYQNTTSQPLSQDIFGQDGVVVGLSDDLRSVIRQGSGIAVVAGEELVFERRASAGGLISNAAISANGTFLIYSDEAGMIHLVNLDTGTDQMTIENDGGRVLSLAFNQAASLIAGAFCTSEYPDSQGKPVCDKNLIKLWDQGTGELKNEFETSHDDFITALAFTPDGSKLASGGEDQQVFLWDLNTGIPAGPSIELISSSTKEAVSSLAFSPDGTTLAAGSTDGSLGLWDMHTWQPIGKLANAGPVITALKYSSTSELISGALDGTIKSWYVDYEDWVRRACAVAGRPLNAAEIQQFLPEAEADYQPTCQ